jgi:hypothetical protein
MKHIISLIINDYCKSLQNPQGVEGNCLNVFNAHPHDLRERK